MKTFTAEIFGAGWRQGPTATFNSITEARCWAEEFGTTADCCTIRDSHHRVIAEHRRDPSSNKWFKAAVFS